MRSRVGLFAFRAGTRRGFRRGLTLTWLALFIGSLLLQYGALTSPKTVFAAATSASLDQCANGAPGSARLACLLSQWQNGNLNESNSQYREGDSVPFRALITVSDSGPH